SVADGGCQTMNIQSENVEVQSYEAYDQEVQTDLVGDYTTQLADSDSKALANFLHLVEPMVMKCLANNLKSRAFNDVSDHRESVSEAVTCVHTLFNSDMKEQLQVTDLSWNATGSTLAASYPFCFVFWVPITRKAIEFDHEDWCTHKAALCTWNLDRRGIKEDKPDTVIDSPCCLMCIEFHPVNPAWLAGGNFSGEIILWDLSREDDLVLATSGIGNDAHREPVSKVHWIKSQSSGRRDYDIISIIWKLETGRVIIWIICIMADNLYRAMKVRATRGDKEVGVTCISFSHEDPDLFVLGSESGCIFKCNLHATGRPAGNYIDSSVPLCSPVTFTFNPHHGPVHSVDYSRFHRNAFLSAGMDQTLRLYSVLQAHPIVTIEPGDGYLFSARWSPVKPSVLAVTTENGNLLLYDLRQGQMVPVHKLEASPNRQPVYSLQFNTQQKSILATGDGQGYIRVFRLGEALTSMSGRDTEVLEEIMNTGID
ncbi:unnamed protein product, partial [Candidula unifasciata]